MLSSPFKAFVDNTNDADHALGSRLRMSGTARSTNQQLPLLRIVVFGQTKTLLIRAAHH